MKQIYQMSQETLVWLGNPNDADDLAFRMISVLSEVHKELKITTNDWGAINQPLERVVASVQFFMPFEFVRFGSNVHDPAHAELAHLAPWPRSAKSPGSIGSGSFKKSHLLAVPEYFVESIMRHSTSSEEPLKFAVVLNSITGPAILYLACQAEKCTTSVL
ncbi:hypothetical protein D0859_00860 [Hortaea werneckii]|uniref:Uncharacterized protein n=1 Tax=Hortaea werneckii TaxID=91943 RepID=A0A3M7JB72_HORWE|nr:hypothetical protein D0859_00860 [Hortaea werneckii]